MAEKKENLTNGSDKNHLMVLYQTIRDNQELYMLQQWKISHYTILLFGGLFFVFTRLISSKNLSGFDIQIKVIFSATGFILSFFSCLIIRNLEYSLRETRIFIRRIERKVPIIKSIVRKPRVKVVKYGPFTSKVGCILLFANIVVFIAFLSLVLCYSEAHECIVL